MALIDVTIDVRDFDPDTGPSPAYAGVTFSRLSPAVEGGILVTTNPIAVPLSAGHGTVKLKTGTAYLVRCLQFGGFAGSFAVMTGTSATSLGELWRTGQIDPGLGAIPVPQTVAQAIALRAPLDSPALTGTPTAPTAPPNDSSTTIATTAWVAQAISSGLLLDLPQWRPNRVYTAGFLVVNPAGQIVQAKADFTSGAVYNPANWSVLSLTLDAVQALIAMQAASDADTYATKEQLAAKPDGISATVAGVLFPDTGWGIGTDGLPTFYGIGSVPAGRGAYPTFLDSGDFALIPTGA